MSDADVALLVRTLDLTTHMYPKPRRSPAPGAVRLDHYSGLFLELGAAEGQWVLEARTWGHPAPENVHEWQVSLPARRTCLTPPWCSQSV